MHQVMHQVMHHFDVVPHFVVHVVPLIFYIQKPIQMYTKTYAGTTFLWYHFVVPFRVWGGALKNLAGPTEPTGSTEPTEPTELGDPTDPTGVK